MTTPAKSGMCGTSRQVSHLQFAASALSFLYLPADAASSSSAHQEGYLRVQLYEFRIPSLQLGLTCSV